MKKLTAIRKRLQKQRGRFPEIAKDTGLGLEWLRKLSQGRFNEIGLGRYERLTDWLDAHE